MFVVIIVAQTKPTRVMIHVPIKNKRKILDADIFQGLLARQF